MRNLKRKGKQRGEKKIKEWTLRDEETRKEEADEKYFGSQTILLEKGRKNQKFVNYINTRKYGQGKYVGLGMVRKLAVK